MDTIKNPEDYLEGKYDFNFLSWYRSAIRTAFPVSLREGFTASYPIHADLTGSDILKIGQRDGSWKDVAGYGDVFSGFHLIGATNQLTAFHTLILETRDQGLYEVKYSLISSSPPAISFLPLMAVRHVDSTVQGSEFSLIVRVTNRLSSGIIQMPEGFAFVDAISICKTGDRATSSSAR